MILREYQKEAIEAFENNNSIGLLEMATGTGKTITALSAINRHYKINKRQFLVIIVPYLHLIEQWVNDFSLIGITNYLEIARNKSNWYHSLKTLIWDYNKKFRDRVVLIGSYKSMADLEFQTLLTYVKDNRFLVADECHNIGVSSYKTNIFNNFECRLGLSATPKRWWDEEGSKRVNDIFDKSVYEYDIDNAIKNGFLTQYFYYPQLIELDSDEIHEYEIYTNRIAKIILKEKRNKEDQKILEILLRKRSNIIKNAKNKIPKFLQLIRKQKDKRYTLVYCAAGEIDKIIQLLYQEGIKAHRFNYEVDSRERRKILDLFEKGEIEVLVAIKCLDEGVDVPATRTAYLLASTSNPREFVQRRGRILRLSDGKDYSNIFDFITLQKNLSYKIFDSIAKRELPRYAELSNIANNRFSNETRKEIRNLLASHDLEMYLNMKPWEMYMLQKEENGGWNEHTI